MKVMQQRSGEDLVATCSMFLNIPYSSAKQQLLSYLLPRELKAYKNGGRIAQYAFVRVCRYHNVRVEAGTMDWNRKACIIVPSGQTRVALYYDGEFIHDPRPRSVPEYSPECHHEPSFKASIIHAIQEHV